jgi:hypothetical protein
MIYIAILRGGYFVLSTRQRVMSQFETIEPQEGTREARWLLRASLVSQLSPSFKTFQTDRPPGSKALLDIPFKQVILRSRFCKNRFLSLLALERESSFYPWISTS